MAPADSGSCETSAGICCLSLVNFTIAGLPHPMYLPWSDTWACWALCTSAFANQRERSLAKSDAPAAIFTCQGSRTLAIESWSLRERTGAISFHAVGGGGSSATGGSARGSTMTCVVIDARSMFNLQKTARCGALGPGDTLIPFIDLAIPVEIMT